MILYLQSATMYCYIDFIVASIKGKIPLFELFSINRCMVPWSAEEAQPTPQMVSTLPPPSC